MILFIVRHGKAERSAPSGRDEDRALNDRGVRQSLWLGETIARMPERERPGIILTSPAKRALTTAQLIRKGLQTELRAEQALALGASIDETADLIRRAAGSDEPVLLVGHNPTLEFLVEALTSRRDGEMRTGEAAILEIPDEAALDGGCRLIGRLRLDD